MHLLQTGEGLLTTSNTPALDGEMVFANQVGIAAVAAQLQCQDGWQLSTLPLLQRCTHI